MITQELLKQKEIFATGIEKYFLGLAQQLMTAKGLERTPAVGAYISADFKIPRTGDEIIIPKGVTVRTTSKRGSMVTKRQQVISVHRIAEGGLYTERGDVVEIPASIIWTGSGSYWHEVSVSEWILAGGSFSCPKEPCV